jgi:hypothetical protein
LILSGEDHTENATGRVLRVPLWIALPLVGILWIVVGAWRIHGFGSRDWPDSFLFSSVLSLGSGASLGLWVLIGR